MSASLANSLSGFCDNFLLLRTVLMDKLIWPFIEMLPSNLLRVLISAAWSGSAIAILLLEYNQHHAQKNLKIAYNYLEKTSYGTHLTAVLSYNAIK